MIVGTNRNLLPGDLVAKNDLIKQKFDKIKEFISDKIYAKNIVEPFFAVSIETPSPNDTTLISDDIEELKKVIELVSINESYMGEQQPVKWQKFEKSLDKLKSKGLFYASLSQVDKIFLYLKNLVN